MNRRHEHWFTRYGIFGIIAVQLFIFSLRMTDPFIDGRFHTNWGGPFWLMKAEQMVRVSPVISYFGIVSAVTSTPTGLAPESWYSSHPQFIAIPLYVWARLFGFHEWTVRSLAAVFTVATTLVMWYALRQRHTSQQALLFSLIWVLLPAIMIYGNKLDQEPLVYFFFSVACVAHERYMRSDTGMRLKKIMPVIFGGAVMFMLWSDWSGFVFAACCAVLFFLARRHIAARAFLWSTIAGGALGAAVVGVQTLATRNHSSEMDNFTGLYNVYKYRSGTTVPHFWYGWLQKQYRFFGLNYGVLGALAGIGGFAWWLRTRARESLATQGVQLWHLFLVMCISTFLYALIVPQATSIHIYYQIFYSFAVAYGIMRGYECAVAWYGRRQAGNGSLIMPYVLMALLAVTVYGGIKHLYQDVTGGWGTVHEINLLKKLHGVPQDKQVVAIVDNRSAVWLGNANIEWYTGRVIKNIAPEQALLTDWAVITADSQDEKIAALDSFTATSTQFVSRGCSPGFCLLERIPKKKK